MAKGFQSDADARDAQRMCMGPQEYYAWRADRQDRQNRQLAGLAQQGYSQANFQAQQYQFAQSNMHGVACPNQDINEYGTSGMEIMTRGYTDEDLILLL